MAAALFLLFTAACVTVLAGQVSAQSQCKEISRGDQMGVPITLPDQILTAGIQDWKVPISLQVCDVVHKTRINTCDMDVAPDVSFLSPELAFVHRNGDLNSNAVVHITLYCN